MALNGPGYTGMVYVAPGPGTVFTDEATTKNTTTVTLNGISYSAYQVYSITNAAKRYWDLDTAITVKKNSSVVTNYSYQACGGIIIFASANISTDVITVSGKYFPYSKASGIKSYNLKLGHKLADATKYTDTDDVCKPMNKNGSGSLVLIDFDNYYTDLLGQRLVGVFLLGGTYNAYDSSGPRWECYFLLNGWTTDLPVDDLISQSHDFTISHERHYRST